MDHGIICAIRAQWQETVGLEIVMWIVAASGLKKVSITSGNIVFPFMISGRSSPPQMLLQNAATFLLKYAETFENKDKKLEPWFQNMNDSKQMRECD